MFTNKAVKNKHTYSVFRRLLTGSLPWEFESSENPKWAEKSVGPWESLTVEKPETKTLKKINIKYW